MSEIEAINRIRWFMNLPEARPGSPWDKDLFEERTYIQWACKELIQELMNYSSISTETTIDAFWLRMLQYYHYSSSPRMRKVFQVAMDTADTIKAMI